jgi:hypothetical protein
MNPKLTMAMCIHQDALLMHAHTLRILNHGSLLDGSSWFLEAYNKVWKQRLVPLGNGGSCNATTPFEQPHDKQREAGRARQLANSAAKVERAVWSCSHPHVRHFAAKGGPGAVGMEDTVCAMPSKDSHEQCTRQPRFRLPF